MGVFLGQLPPAELARLKAELAETLIAHFCYPRFYDYRTNALRTRPVDRTKRQEVWLYLSSVDFTAWNRIDVMTSDFQHQLERLIIHFVQRNRSFFGEQGRKRMSDVRMLIGSSALAVAQGLRGHVTGHHQTTPPFGSPRPVSSWSATNITGRPEPGWEQLAQQTMLLQQQLQEVRGEIKSASVAVPTLPNEARPATAAPRRATRVPTAPVNPIPQPTTANGTNKAERAATPRPVAPVQASKTPQQDTGCATPPLPNSTKSTSPSPVSPVWHVATAAVPKVEPIVSPIELPTAPVSAVITPGKPEVAAPHAPAPEKVQPPVPMPASVHVPAPEKVQPPVLVPTASPVQHYSVPSTATTTVTHNSSDVLVSEEDVAIFEQMRHQLMVWLRVEAIRAGVDISNQGPTQLLDLLRQQEKYDETRLQIVSTLLNLCNQVMKNGKAGLYDYKQALMFHLMHTRR